jgi:hypothetical protein
MAHYKLIALTNVLNRRDDEFNEWYDNVHLRDALAVEGVVGAQRFKLHDGTKWGYFTLYDFDCDDPAAVFAELLRRSGTEVMPLSDSLDQSTYFAAIAEPIGVHRTAASFGSHAE